MYAPLAVRLPDGAGVERSYAGLGLGPGELALCDRRTVFSDVFASADGRELICIGPPWDEFGPPLAVAVDGRARTFRAEVPTEFDIRRAALLRVALAASARGVVEVRVEFARFAVAATVDLDAQLPWRLRRVALTLAAVQKDNPLAWLRDWCLWHRRAHGFERVVVYDNGSRDADVVHARLGAAAARFGMELIVVRWGFPYGPPRRFAANLAQTVAFNHCRLRFGGATRWCVNLDVDEYLYNASDRPLEACLASAARDGIAYLPQYRVPCASAGATERCFASPRREIRLQRRAGRKVAYRPPLTRWNEVHSAAPVRRSLPNRVAGRAVAALRRAPAPVRIALAALAGRLRWPVAPEPTLFFYHFRALNTGWKFPRAVPPAGARGLVDDVRIPAMAALLDEAD